MIQLWHYNTGGKPLEELFFEMVPLYHGGLILKSVCDTKIESRNDRFYSFEELKTIDQVMTLKIGNKRAYFKTFEGFVKRLKKELNA